MTYQKVIKAVWGEGVNEANIKKLQVNIANIRKNLPVFPFPFPAFATNSASATGLDG